MCLFFFIRLYDNLLFVYFHVNNLEERFIDNCIGTSNKIPIFSRIVLQGKKFLFYLKLGGDVKVTEKQKMFADEYLKDLNATRAYKKVYTRIKSDGAARANASKLLTKANIKAYIDEQLEKMHNENTADIQEIMEYLTSVMRGKSHSNVLAMSGDGYQEVIEKPPDEKERLKAAELLGKRFRMFTENGCKRGG